MKEIHLCQTCKKKSECGTDEAATVVCGGYDSVTNEMKLYLKIADNLEFKNCFVVERHDARHQIDYLFEQFHEVAEEDENELCVKVVEMTENEFNNLPEFTGF